jgi:hypothetical protein
MDFTNLAAVEFVGAIEAQRDHERKQRKWLLQWHDLRRAADARLRAASRVTAEADRKAA